MKILLTALALPFFLLSASVAETKPTVDPKFAATMKAEGYSAVKFAAENNHFFVDVTIGGKKGKFLVDTGAMASLLKEASVTKYDVELTDANVEAAGVGGTKMIKSTAKTKTLACGGVKDISQSFYVMALSHWPKSYSDRLDGILGTDFLKARKAIFDYAHGILWLRRAPAKTANTSKLETDMKPLGYTAIQFVEEQNHLFIHSTISGKKARFVIDSGAIVSLFKEAAVEKFDFTLIKGRAVISGVVGPIEIKAMAKTKQLKLGSTDPVAQDFYVVNMTEWPQAYVNRLDGVLGNDFLKAKKSLIDYERSVLWVKES